MTPTEELSYLSSQRSALLYTIHAYQYQDKLNRYDHDEISTLKRKLKEISDKIESLTFEMLGSEERKMEKEIRRRRIENIRRVEALRLERMPKLKDALEQIRKEFGDKNAAKRVKVEK